MGSERLRFNHRVQVEITFLCNPPVIHMVDKATRFGAASFIRNQTTTEIWNTIQISRCLVYLGPSEFLSVDQGLAYTSREIKKTIEAFRVRIKETPIDTPGAIEVV